MLRPRAGQLGPAGPTGRSAACEAITRVAAHPGLSNDVREIVGKALALASNDPARP